MPYGNMGAWPYFKMMTVNNASGSTLTDYQVPIKPFADNSLVNYSNLIGAFHFSEGSGTYTADMSGYGKNGLLVNSPTWISGPSARYGTALQFNGTNQYVTVGNLDMTTALTFAAWIKKGRSSPSGFDRLIVAVNSSGWGVFFDTPE